MRLTSLLAGVGTLIFAPCLCLASVDSVDPAHTLWYKNPAKHWMKEALPIGNGSFGAMIFGSAERERIHLNVDSLWTGDSNSTGSYQSLGVAYITFDNSGKASEYSRTLDLKSAVHQVEFKANGVVQKRESFASAPDKVIVVNIEGKGMSGRIKLEDDLRANSRERSNDKKSRKESNVTATKNSILMKGALVNDLRYAAQLRAACKGGSLSVEGNELVFKNVDTLAILIAGETDYAMDMAKNWRGEDPEPVVKARLDAAAKKGLSSLREDHVKNYKKLYDRFTFDVGATSADRAKLPTNERLLALKNDSKLGMDPDFNELLVNYARYLMISCSRPGCLPANLQGLWCENNSPPWRSDYHSNINVQMNYWFALPMNLADCHQSFCDYVMAIRDARLPRTAKEVRLHTGKFATRGWAIKTENNIFGGSGWKWNFPGAAWYAQHLYEQYAFTQDQAVLKNQAYVVLKEICEFWEERLKVREDGTLVVPNGWSPEHGPTEDGVTYDQMIVFDLFTNYIEAAADMGVDPDYAKRIKEMRSKLLRPKIGKWGQLQEWETDRDKQDDHHRHVSHLFGVHPGRQVIPGRDRKLTDAAIVSLNARGDGGTGWSKAWKISFWARLRDGDRSHKLMNEHIVKNFYDNLFDFHPPFQIDGNFGHAAGVAECLLQSHQRTDESEPGASPWIIELLPALPSAWRDGSVSGLCARGGVTVDMKWRNGKLQLTHLTANRNTSVMVKYGKKKKLLTLRKGQALPVTLGSFNPKKKAAVYIVTAESKIVTTNGEQGPKIGEKIYTEGALPQGACGTYWVWVRDGRVSQMAICNHEGGH